MCGENVPQRELERDAVGSSPRVRGKRSLLVLMPKGKRLIPACAGKTNPTFLIT